MANIEFLCIHGTVNPHEVINRKKIPKSNELTFNQISIKSHFRRKKKPLRFAAKQKSSTFASAQTGKSHTTSSY
jgi:hypothetical protein